MSTFCDMLQRAGGCLFSGAECYYVKMNEQRRLCVAYRFPACSALDIHISEVEQGRTPRGRRRDVVDVVDLPTDNLDQIAVWQALNIDTLTDLWLIVNALSIYEAICLHLGLCPKVEDWVAYQPHNLDSNEALEDAAPAFFAVVDRIAGAEFADAQRAAFLCGT